jgi:hypothetical protein
MSLASAPPSSPRALGAGELAWVALLPCALVVLAGVVLLAPPLGHAFLGPGSDALWPSEARYVIGQPEPVKHARFLIALAGPVLLAGALLAGARWRPAGAPAALRALAVVSQALVGAFLVAATLRQTSSVARDASPLWPIFGVPTLVTGLVLGLALLAAARSRAVVRRVAALARETRVRRVACVLVALAFTAMWLSSAVDTDASIGNAQGNGLVWWTLDDPFAILNGRTPLVDFHAMYAQLWPYPPALAMHLLGATVTVYTLTMTSASALALLAIYAVFRRIVRSPLLALALYLPFLATGFLFVLGPHGSDIRLSSAQIFSMWPMRYGGAYALAWLTARHVDGAAPRRAWPLFLAGGLVALDNLEFGAAALAATLVAVACLRLPRSREAWLRLAAELAIGLLGAAALVSLLTLVRAGALPDFGSLLEFPRIFGVLGLVAMRMPLLGFHLVVYATLVATIGVAAVRLVRGERDVLLTSMLAWSGTFGLLAAGYYVGRSDTLKLVSLFSAWAFALALLVVVALRALAGVERRRPGLADVMVLVAFGLAICSLAETPTPWSQRDRLREVTPTPVFKQEEATRFVAARTRPHERVAILIPLGHRIAHDVGIVNVAPYSFIEEMVTRPQWQTLLDAVHREHVHAIFLPDDLVAYEQLRLLSLAGFSQRARASRYAEWTDAASG